MALAIPYDVQRAYDSIALLLITNLPAVVFRNLHYWSAQFFLVFTLLHTLEQIKLRTAANRGLGVWFRLVISLLAVFYVMLSGFILKADADSLQAFRILEALLVKIPLAGKYLASVLLGDGDDFQLLYVHHIATATIFLLYIIFEHVATLLSKKSTFLILLAVLTLLSFTLHAPLHDNLNPVLKGPWYFIGLQEVLHWTGRPAWVWLGVLGILSLIYLSYSAGERSNRVLYKLLVYFSLVYGILILVGYYFRGENWEWVLPWEKEKIEQTSSLEAGIRLVSDRFSSLTASDIAVVQGKREACMNCHSDVGGFSPAHDPVAIGCTACHLGNPFSLHKTTAHKGMITIPGNLNTSRLSCGTTACHPDISERINTSLMTTNSGLVSVDRFVFGERPTPDELSFIREIGHSPADKHLRDLCANCHLGNEKLETGPIDQMSRGGGCNACHLNYTPEGIQQHAAYMEGGKVEELLPKIHPSLDLNITNDHCFGCHSRSGRISTNYEGWHETQLEATEVSDDKRYRILQDKRVFEYVAEDIHHAAGMDCIDCHNSYEVMGDGTYYLHEEQAVTTTCEDCHFTRPPRFVEYSELDVETKKIFDLRAFDHVSKKMVRLTQTDRALVNVYLDGDSAWMVSKNTGERSALKAPTAACTQQHGHESVSCSACHTAWAPSCIGCHNVFEKDARGYDLLESEFVQGEWVEYVGTFLADAPALGVHEGDGSLKKVLPAVPGMVLSIDRGSFYNDAAGETLFHRLYAPVAPHTTAKQGRNCKSCHMNPTALGYGRGEIRYDHQADLSPWSFRPTFANNKTDGLPEDAWIPFLPENPAQKNAGRAQERPYSTRTDFRPFSVDEQYRILRVGVCLSCHGEDSEVMLNSLKEDFDGYLMKAGTSCIIPEIQSP